VVELAVPSRVEPVPSPVSRGRLDGGGGVVGGEMASGGEPTDVTHRTQDDGRSYT
jgi:hypothetical protein